MIKIYNSSLDYIGFLDRFESFQCSLKYTDSGSFSIKTLLTRETTELLKVGNFIQYKDFAGMIDSIQMTEDIDSVPLLEVSGYDLTGLLDLRIIWNDIYFNGKSEEFLRKVVKENAITPTVTERKIPFLDLDSLSGLPQNTERNTEKETLLEECQKVCKVADYGFSIRLDAKQKKMLFRVYEGADRTAGKPNQIIIGKDFDNVERQDYSYSIRNEKTTCLVTSDITSVTVGDAAAGFNRRETVIKSSKGQESLTLPQYQNVLRSEGKEKLESAVKCFDIDTYNADLSLGDKVSIKDKEWNINFDTRVEEKQITVQKGIETTTFLLGKDIVIKKEIK